MGLDLKLVVIEDCGPCAYGPTVIDVWRRHELFDELMKIKDHPTPENFTTYLGRTDDGEYTYGKVTETPYGEHLTYVLAYELHQYRDHVGVTDNHYNRAAWAYLAQLPPETKIALYWS
jgi:hypothetical protein